MQRWLKGVISIGAAVLVIAAWIIYFHNAAVAGIFPKDSWARHAVGHFGKTGAAMGDGVNATDPTKNDIPVRAGEITLETVHRYVEGYGRIEPRLAGVGQVAGGASIASVVTGQVAKVLCAQGQQVKAGEALIQLDDRLAKAAEEQAQAGLGVQEAALAVLRGSSTAEQLAEAQAKVQAAQAALAGAKAAREMLTIRAPIDATVMDISVNPGEVVYRTRTLVRLVALDRLMADVDLPADELPDNAAGLAAQVFVGGGDSDNDDDDVYVLCKVTYVSGEMEPGNGAVAVDIDLPAPDAKHEFRPGQRAGVKIMAEVHNNVLVVPVEAVVTDEDGNSVISLLDGDMAKRKVIGVGLAEKGLVEISAVGLKAGMKVVTTGAAGLPEVTRVKVEK